MSTIKARIVDISAILVAIVLIVFFWPLQFGGCTGLVIINGHSMEPTLYPGDLIVTRCTPAPAIDDIVVYTPFPKEKTLIAHRIIDGDANNWILQGDNNDFIDPFKVTSNEVKGVSVLHIPFIGKIIYFFTAPLVWLSMFLLAIAIWIWPSKVIEVSNEETDDNDA